MLRTDTDRSSLISIGSIIVSLASFWTYAAYQIAQVLSISTPAWVLVTIFVTCGCFLLFVFALLHAGKDN